MRFPNILIIKKPNKNMLEFKLLKSFLNCKIAKLTFEKGYLRTKYPSINLISESNIDDNKNSSSTIGKDAAKMVGEDGRAADHLKADLVITLGGDGTILHTSSLFPLQVPPIMSFSLGSLGFLPCFDFANFKSDIDQVLAGGKFTILDRMRLACLLKNEKDGQVQKSHLQIMNEVTVHRGHNVQLGHIDCFINDNYLTDAVADGLIVSTPTGSTAYSLSAGGPIVHPRVPSMLLTPICPRSLSFRSLVLPPEMIIRMKLSEKARGDALVSGDGRNLFNLSHGRMIEIKQSPFPIPFIQSTSTEWLKGITKQLRWNQAFVAEKYI